MSCQKQLATVRVSGNRVICGKCQQARLKAIQLKYSLTNQLL